MGKSKCGEERRFVEVMKWWLKIIYSMSTQTALSVSRCCTAIALLGLWLRPETINRCAHFATRSLTTLPSRRIWARCGNVLNWNNSSRWLTGRSQFSINEYCLKWMEPFIQFLLLLSITSSNDEKTGNATVYLFCFLRTHSVREYCHTFEWIGCVSSSTPTMDRKYGILIHSVSRDAIIFVFHNNQKDVIFLDDEIWSS